MNPPCKYHVGEDFLLQKSGSHAEISVPTGLGAMGRFLAYMQPSSTLASSPHIVKHSGTNRVCAYIGEDGYDTTLESLCNM